MALIATAASPSQDTGLGPTSFRSAITGGDFATDALLWGIRIGLILLFVTPAIVTTSAVFPFVVGKAVWSRSIIEIIVGLYVLLALRSPEFRAPRSVLALLLGVHLAAVFIAGVFGSSFNLSFWSNFERMGGIFGLAHWIALAVVLIFTVRTLREWKVVAGIYLLASWAPLVIALGEILEIDLFSYSTLDWASGRVKGASGNPTFLAGQMAVNIVLALALVVSLLEPLRQRRGWIYPGLAAFYALTALASLWVLSDTETRGSFLGLLAGFGTIGVLLAFTAHTPRVRYISAAVLVGGVVIFAGLFIARDTPPVEALSERNNLVSRVLDISLTEGSGSTRVIGYRIAWEAFIDRPLTGWGGENFEVPYQQFQREGEIPPGTNVLDRAHNKLLDLLATTGLLGFATYVATWSWLGFLALRRVRSGPEDRYLHIVVFGALITLLVHNMFLFDTGATLMLFGLIAAWAVASERPAGPAIKAEQPSEPTYVYTKKALRWIAPPVVGLIVVAGVLGINYRSYRAAQLFTETGSTVAEVAANLDHFGPLATFGRERLINVMAGGWEAQPPDARVGLVPEIRELANSALAAEPDNMELHFAVARFYRVAAADIPELMELAKFHTDRGAKLGPETVSTARALEEQLGAETEAELLRR